MNSPMRIVQAFPMLKAENSLTARAGGFELPIGSEIIRLVSGGEGPSLVVLAPPNALRVPHLVVYAAIGEEVIVPAGKTLGPCLGLHPVGNDVIAIFPVYPWPTAGEVLEAMPAAGNG